MNRDRTRHKTFIRAWRQYRGLSLRALENRIGEGEDGRPLISHVSLGRIERGEQPYNQDTIEAIAAALGVEPAILIACEPGGVDPFLSCWRRLNVRQRKEALVMLEALANITE